MKIYRVSFTDSCGCESRSVVVDAKNKKAAKWQAYQEYGCNFSCYESFIDFCRCVYSVEED